MKTITRKSMLYKTNVEYANYTMNYVFGCYHGCKYPCYAMQMSKRFGLIKTYDEWIEPKLVSNTLELLDKELPKISSDIQFVHLCFTTDPFMYKQCEIHDLTFKVIQKLNSYNIPVEILTKGEIPEEIFKVSTHKDNIFGISLVSLDEEFRLKYEPNSASFEKRIESLKKCHENGIKTWVSIEPYPTPNICKQNLVTILNEIKFVDYIVFGRWNYNKEISSYTYSKKFYNEQCNIIEEFCHINNIKLHIKENTITKQ